jgi:all-trans-retinol 13,14-reductase
MAEPPRRREPMIVPPAYGTAADARACRPASSAASDLLRTSVPEHFDTIVIGSGMGGLTCASLLAQLRGQRVLVLERHHRLGGFTHRFQRPGGRAWDVGLHYVGKMRPGEPVRALMDLVTGGRVQWNAMPTPFERYVYPDLSFDQPVGEEAYLESLASRWPDERNGIRKYFSEVSSAARWVGPYLLSHSGPGFSRWPARLLRRFGRTKALRTTSEVLDACVRARDLKAVLASQWGDYGLPPAQSAFFVHAVIVSHYLSGGWYPVGGAGRIAEGARSQIEAAGGVCLMNHTVESIMLERGRAVGVRVRRGKARGGETVEYRAPVIVSNAGARLTFEQLLGDAQNPALSDLRKALDRLPRGYGAVQLFLGLRESPELLGFRGENHWLFDGYDHDALFARRNRLFEGSVSVAYLSFPSLKDPEATTHTAEIIAPLDHTEVRDWMHLPWKRRGEEYEALKARISDALLSFVELHYPRFTELVEYRELATPLSVEHFAAHPGGAIYGLPAVPERYGIEGLGIRTPIRGLLLTGSDVAVHGIVGAMMGGVGTAAHVLGGAGFIRIMATAGRGARRETSVPG